MIADKWRDVWGEKEKKLSDPWRTWDFLCMVFMGWRVLRVLLLGFGDGRVREAAHLIFLAFIVKVAAILPSITVLSTSTPGTNTN
jgi:hypothetical protein